MPDYASKITFYELKYPYTLKDDMNYEIDDISDYLTAYKSSSASLTNFRFIKHSLTMIIKVDLNNVTLTNYSLSPTNDGRAYSYCAIQNYSDTNGSITYLDTLPVYYFITHKRMIAQETIEYTLKMDTLNTCQYGDQDSPYGYMFSDKTYVIREHKDRFNPTPINTNTYLRDIDMKNEGLNPVIFNNENGDKIIQDNDDVNWYLVIMNTSPVSGEAIDLDNPIKFFLCSDKQKQVYEAKVLNPDMTPTEYDYFVKVDDSNMLFYLNLIEGGVKVLGFEGDTKVFKIYQINPDGFYVKVYKTDIDNDTLIEIESYQCSSVQVTTRSSGHTYKYRYSTSNLSSLTSISTLTLNTITLTSKDVIGLNTKDYATQDYLIDRTNPQIIKIIALPYRPFDYRGGDKLPIMLKFNDTYKLLEYIPENDFSGENSMYGTIYIDDEISPFKDYSLVITSFSKTTLKDKKYESKLYASEFYMPKFVYDSFAHNFPLDKIEITTEFQIKNPVALIKTSLTGSSRFMFSFSSQYKYPEATYPNVLPVTRNNELPLYNVAYLNYLKVGYNYDVKAKNLSLSRGILSMGVTTIGAVATGVATGGATALAGVMSVGTSVANVINSQISSQTNIEKQLAQSANQGANISGSDDYDLMAFYTEGNKAKIEFASISDRMKDLVWKLFYYTGYASDRYGYPARSSRCWFNYYQVNPIYEISNGNITDEILGDLTLKFKQGVTQFHANTISGVKTWDMFQRYENWENILL